MHLKSEKTVITLSNAVELSTAIVVAVAGGEVADSLNGSVVTRSAYSDIIASQINKNFSNYTSQGAK